MTELVLPLPPSANAIWQRTRYGMAKSEKYKGWLRDAGYLAKGQHPAKISGRYKLSVLAVRPDKRRRDLDNLLKATSDLLVGLQIIQDDSYCEMIVARWVTSGEGMMVRLEPAGSEE